MKRIGRDKFKVKRNTGWFLKMPVEVLDSPRYCGLSFKARALLLDLGAQYRGNNNGDMAAPWSLMKTRGWRSKETLRNALLELLGAGMIELTRQGGLHCPSLYALTWLEINECGGKLDVEATQVASGAWRKPLSVHVRSDGGAQATTPSVAQCPG